MSCHNRRRIVTQAGDRRLAELARSLDSYSGDAVTQKRTKALAATLNVLAAGAPRRGAARAIIVGAGVFGAWTAEHLQRAGRHVMLVDQAGPANLRASSGGESRMSRSSYDAAKRTHAGVAFALAEITDTGCDICCPVSPTGDSGGLKTYDVRAATSPGHG